MPDSRIVFVDNAGGDRGTCSRTAPCGTLAFALTKASSARNNIKILSGTLQLAESVTLAPSLYIEGNSTIVTGPAGMFSIPQSVNVTLSHLRLQPTSGLITTVSLVRTLRLFDVRSSGGVEVSGGALEMDRSTFSGASAITCTSGTMSIRRSVLDRSPVSATTCALVIRQNRFDMVGDAGFNAQGGPLTFENNLIMQTEGIADSMALSSVAPGSTVRFNTFVNTAALVSDGVALSCDSAVDVSSNIFAYGSRHPHGDSANVCAPRYSLYDTVAVPDATRGVGCRTADGNSFFVDKSTKDFHLSLSSPARGAGEPGLGVVEDLDGNRRPAQEDGSPDIGAFEAP